jgi:hypothetical protein
MVYMCPHCLCTYPTPTQPALLPKALPLSLLSHPKRTTRSLPFDASQNCRRISVFDTQGSVTTLCYEKDLKSKQACTVIADTGYDAMVVAQDQPRNALEGLLREDAPVCAIYLKVWAVQAGMLAHYSVRPWCSAEPLPTGAVRGRGRISQRAVTAVHEMQLAEMGMSI